MRYLSIFLVLFLFSCDKGGDPVNPNNSTYKTVVYSVSGSNPTAQFKVEYKLNTPEASYPFEIVGCGWSKTTSQTTKDKNGYQTKAFLTTPREPVNKGNSTPVTFTIRIDGKVVAEQVWSPTMSANTISLEADIK